MPPTVGLYGAEFEVWWCMILRISIHGGINAFHHAVQNLLASCLLYKNVRFEYTKL
jgi:hypothetical protein